MLAHNSLRPQFRDLGGMALVGLSLVAVLDAMFNYFASRNGIHGSEGALLVVASTLLMLLAALVSAMRWSRSWLRALLGGLLLLDFLGTAAAAYFLNAWLLLMVVVLCFVAWAARLARPAISLSKAG